MARASSVNRCAGLGRAGQLRPDDLQGHRPEQVGVFGLKDQPHPALADAAADAVMGQPAELARGPRRVEEIVGSRLGMRFALHGPCR